VDTVREKPQAQAAGLTPRYPRSAAPVPSEAGGPKVRTGPAGARALSAFLPRLTRKAFQKYGFASASLVTEWSNIVGEDVASYTAPERLKWPRLPDAYADDGPAARTRPGATLVVRVDGGRALEVQYRSRQLLERINAYFGYRAVAELRLIQAPIAHLCDGQRRKVRIHKQVTQDTAVSPAVAAVGNSELRSALARLEAHIRALR
jgi:hypothetical protein